MNFSHIFSHGLYSKVYTADYDKHIVPIEDETDRKWALVAAYNYGDLKADYEKHIAPFCESDRVNLLGNAYRSASLVPDPTHLNFVEEDSLCTVLRAAHKAGLQFDEKVLDKFSTETMKANVLAEAYEAKALKANYQAHIVPYIRSTPRAVALAAAYKHGGLVPDPDHWLYFNNESDFAMVIAEAYNPETFPDFKDTVHDIEDSKAKSKVLVEAYKKGMKPDYEKEIAPLLRNTYMTTYIKNYTKALNAAYESGNLAPDYDLHMKDLLLQERALSLYHAMKHGNFQADFDIHISDLKTEIMYGSLLIMLYESGLTPDFEKHIRGMGIVRDEVLTSAFKHGLEPSADLLKFMSYNCWRKLALCAVYDTGKVLPDYEKDIMPFKEDFDRAWILEHAYKAGLKADFESQISPMKDEIVRALALGMAVKFGGLEIEQRYIDTFTDERAKSILP